jgi:hypothetical protein
MVESFLVAGIAGAGLVLTTLTLAVLKSEDLLRQRAKALAKTKTDFKRKLKKPETETPKLVALAQTIQSLQGLPTYLGAFVTVSFACFVLSSLLAVLWFAADAKAISQQPTQFEQPLELFFIVGVIFFLIMGLVMIADVESALKLRYEELKKEEDARAS